MEPLIICNANGKIKKVAADPVGKWLSCYPEKQRHEKSRKLDHFVAWLNQKEGWHGTDARALIIRHLQSEYEEEVLDLLEEYIREHQSKWRYNSLQPTVRQQLSLKVEIKVWNQTERENKRYATVKPTAIADRISSCSSIFDSEL